jgi:hypothetical protein
LARIFRGSRPSVGTRPAARTALRLERLEERAVPAVFTVTNTDDSGDGSLRQAILDANNTANVGDVPDAIHFNIPGAGVHTIAPASQLPDITDSVVIDGYTQPGSSPNTLVVGDNAVLEIVLNGANAPGGSKGLSVSASGVTIRGLVINGWSSGTAIDFAGAFFSGNFEVRPASINDVVEGCFIGTDAAGTASVPNLVGIALQITVIAVPNPRLVRLEPNESPPTSLSFGSDSHIGGTDPAARNVISGNFEAGIILGGATTAVQGNIVGLDRSATNALGNGNGIEIYGSPIYGFASPHRIGGSIDGAGNFISGNDRNGITIDSGTTVAVQGNVIGLNAAGTPVGNGRSGVEIRDDAQSNTIGGASPGAGNVIAGNLGNGVTVTDPFPTGNAILGNSIFANGGLGIDLGGDGVTANDVGDADAGPNNLQNFPLLSAGISDGTKTTLIVSLNSTPNSTFRIELFRNAAADPSGSGGGQMFLTAVNVTTDSSGNGAVIVTLPPLSAGTVLSATATNVITNDTSEFAPDAFTVQVPAPPPPPPLLTPPAVPTDPLLPPNPGPGLLALIDLFSHHPQLLRGLNLALGDVTGDDVLDVVVAGGRGKQPFVLVVDGQTARIDQAFFAFAPGYRGGVQPNTADVNADGVGDIIAIAPGKKGTHIRVFDGKTGHLIFSL